MNTSCDILLLAADGPGRRLSRRVGQAAGVDLLDEPYGAIERLSRRDWPVVLLSAGWVDFPGLCRAARRLQRNAKVFAICPPALEPDVLPLVGATLDDYFIDPPSRSDIDRIAAAARQASGMDKADPALSVGEGLRADEFGRLVTAAEDIEQLEQAVADVVSRRGGVAVRWFDAHAAPSSPLLVTSPGPSRVLSCENPTAQADAGCGKLLADLRTALPALLGAARRTTSLRHLATTDYLTGTYNRRYFYVRTDQILRRVDQAGRRATLLLYDIDDFKHYNDTYGYAAGDEILRETAVMMKQITRSQDVVSRIGGDEFAVLFWDGDREPAPEASPLSDAFALADRFRRAIAAHAFTQLGPEATGVLTISGGLAHFPGEGRTCRELLASADHALKTAKASGKNAIHLVGRPGAQTANPAGRATRR